MYWRHELAHTHHGDCYLQMTLLCVHTAESSVEVEEELEKLTRVLEEKGLKISREKINYLRPRHCQVVIISLKPGVHTSDFATIHGRPVRIHTAPAEDNTSNQQSTPQALCEYGRGDRESWRNR